MLKPSSCGRRLKNETIDRNVTSIVAVFKPYSKRSTAQSRNSSELSHYGSCSRCQGAVSVPGLDANFCNHCGWIADPIWLQDEVKRSEKLEIEPKRKKQDRRKLAVLGGVA